MPRAIGTTDAVTVCDCCGKSDLMLTVIMLLDDGQRVNYGTTCARRNTGKTAPQIRAEAADWEAEMLARAQAEFKTSPQAATERAAFDTRPRDMVGRAAAEWVSAAVQAADIARKRIATAHGIPERWLSLHR